MKALSKTNKKRHDAFKVEIEATTLLVAKYKSDGEKLKSEHDSFKGEADKKTEMLIESEKMIKKSAELSEAHAKDRAAFVARHSAEGSKQYQKRIGLVL